MAWMHSAIRNEILTNMDVTFVGIGADYPHEGAFIRRVRRFEELFSTVAKVTASKARGYGGGNTHHHMAYIAGTDTRNDIVIEYSANKYSSRLVIYSDYLKKSAALFDKAEWADQKSWLTTKVPMNHKKFESEADPYTIALVVQEMVKNGLKDRVKSFLTLGRFRGVVNNKSENYNFVLQATGLFTVLKNLGIDVSDDIDTFLNVQTAKVRYSEERKKDMAKHIKDLQLLGWQEHPHVMQAEMMLMLDGFMEFKG